MPATNVSDTAQRRPALPGRQLPIAPPRRDGSPAAQRRPALPGRQLRRGRHRRGHGGHRSTKAGPAGPATPGATLSTAAQTFSAQRRPALPGWQLATVRRASAPNGPPLNEGRPCRAGNSRRGVAYHAERVERSTKAGPAGPATRDVRRRRLGARGRAQRRPALPGRQLLVSVHAPGPPETAQRRPALPGRQLRAPPGRVPHVLWRSTKAGPAGPATPASETCVWVGRTPLNEGRPCRAGNSYQPCSGVDAPSGAQRRPALPGRQLLLSLTEIVGSRSRAQRRPALPGRQLRYGESASHSRPPALNEGRPCRAGNSPPSAGHPRGRSALNEGRPCRAGNSQAARGARDRRPHRSTKAGPAGPATHGCPLGCGWGGIRSTKAGPAGPATLPHVNY